MLALLLAMAACKPAPEWQFTDVTGALPDLELNLLDSTGRPVSAGDYLGRTTLLFFGFTNCPGPCPTTLARIGAALEQMGEAGQSVQVLMVTVDPGRDSPDALRRYEKSFGPWLHGLTGDVDELDRLKRDYKVHAQRMAADATGNYDVSHSTVVLAFDAAGRCRLLLSDLSDSFAVAADLRRLGGE